MKCVKICLLLFVLITFVVGANPYDNEEEAWTNIKQHDNVIIFRSKSNEPVAERVIGDNALC